MPGTQVLYLARAEGGCQRHRRTIRDPAQSSGKIRAAAGAHDQYAVLLPIRERVLGAEHPDTLTVRANLAYWAKRA